MNDEQIRSNVAAALLRDGRLSSQPIDVAACEGVVYLTGRVHSYRRKLLAQELAASVCRCRDVVNRLEVEPVEIADDEEVAERARSVLQASADVDKHTITVACRNGHVTLSGTASTEWERTLAEDLVLSVRGVRDVLNLVLVDPAERLEDQALCAQVQAALDRAPLLEGWGIRAAVVGDLIVLSGRVPNLPQKTLAHEIALRYSPRRVRNEIQVER